LYFTLRAVWGLVEFEPMPGEIKEMEAKLEGLDY